MQCHCTEIEELRAENEQLHLRGSYDLAGAETRAELAEAKLAKIAALIPTDEALQRGAQPMVFSSALREVLDA